MTEKVGLVCICVLLVLHLLDVGSCSEGLFGTGEDDGAHLGIIVGDLGGLVELVEECRVESVECLGSVQSDEGDAFGRGRDENVLVLLDSSSRGETWKGGGESAGGERGARCGGAQGGANGRGQHYELYRRSVRLKSDDDGDDEEEEEEGDEKKDMLFDFFSNDSQTCGECGSIEYCTILYSILRERWPKRACPFMLLGSIGVSFNRKTRHENHPAPAPHFIWLYYF